MADFALLALPGAYHSSVGALTDSFGLARDRVEQVFSGFEPVRMETKLRILSGDGGPVTLSDGTQLEVTGAFGGGEIYAFIFLPAFRAGGPAPMADRIAHNRPLLEWLRRQAEGGAIIGASGAAVALLIAAGLTRDIAVPVSRALLPLIRQMFPRQRIEERAALVDHGHLLVANGLGTDFALIVRVMEQTLSPDVAHWLASVIGLEEVEEALVPTDPLVARAQLWLEQRFTGEANVAELAAALSTSQATLNRRFRKATGLSPGGYVQELRLRSACEMLKKSHRSIDRIAQLVGYSDSRLFRAMFRRRTGMTATRWRVEAQASGKR